MSSSEKGKKPDRPFYRHPRYDSHGIKIHRNSELEDETPDLSKSESLVYESNKSNETSAKRNDNKLYQPSRPVRVDKNVNRRGVSRKYPDSYVERSNYFRTRNNDHYSDAPKPYEYVGDTKKHYRPADGQMLSKASVIPNAPSNVSERISTPTNQKQTSTDLNEKRGGLIHLPKGIDIFQQNCEASQATSTSKLPKKSSSAGGSKPVVVVRPSFSHASQQSKQEQNRSNRHITSSELRESFGGNVDGGTAFSNGPDNSTQLPSMLLNEAARTAFQKIFGQQYFDWSETGVIGAPNFPQSAGTTQSPADRLVAHNDLNNSVQAPNEIVARIMQQILELDSTLSGLLIPPGLCAEAIAVLQPATLCTDEGKTMSKSEELFLKWWSTVHLLRNRLFTLFESVILSDLDFCNTAHVEQGMWKSVFYTVLESLRTWIENPDATNLIHANMDSGNGINIRNQLSTLLRRVCISDVIDSGTSQLLNLLEKIQTVHRIHLPTFISDGRPPPETCSRTRRLVYFSAQKLMLFLGDLARYRESIQGENNFGKARSWYQKAQLLVPKNGRSYNQLAVLAVYTSRHLDAMCYFMRTLAASNPFQTASQSLMTLFSQIRSRAENMVHQLQKPKLDSMSSSDRAGFGLTNPKFQRAEIWIHPVDGQTTVIQGGRRLIHLPTYDINQSKKPSPNDMDPRVDDDDEDAQAEAEEYANVSLMELSKQFGLAFIHAHGKLYTKIGMETFPEIASLALQALSGLLAQNPCPLSAERLCQLFVVNMFNVDRAASVSIQPHGQASAKLGVVRPAQNAGPGSSCPYAGIETLRSVHHDHAARFALDTFSLVCRRAAQLLQEPPPEECSNDWLSPDARILLSALRLWSEWMILHPEHWFPPPNDRDPTLRPRLNDWDLVAALCNQAQNWLAKNAKRPVYEELTPTTSLILKLKGNPEGDRGDDDKVDSKSDSALDGLGDTCNAAFLAEESYVAGFKPMLNLTPKMYRYSGDWDPETVADFVRIEKLILFGDYLCGIEPPILNYDVEKQIYESAIVPYSSAKPKDKQPSSHSATPSKPGQMDSSEEPSAKSNLPTDEAIESAANTNPQDIVALQKQRALLQKRLDVESRLATWRQNAIKQAASGGQRAVEIEVRPIYLLPDTNCYIDWLEGIATLAQRSSSYTVLVPIVVLNELDSLAHLGSGVGGSSGFDRLYEADHEVTRTGLMQERAKFAIAYLEHEFSHRNPRLRALTARGSLMETIAYRNEVNGGRVPGQTNDDVILTCCQHFCKETPDRNHLNNYGRGIDPNLIGDPCNQPLRLVREVVLLTSDRNLRVKALNVNIPARPLRTFVYWSRLPLVRNLASRLNEFTSQSEKYKSDFPELQSQGQWKQALKH